MLPTISFLGRELSTYAIMAIIGILVAIFFSEKNANKHNIDSSKVTSLLLFSGIGIIIGGHILYGLTNFDKIIYLFQHFTQIDSLHILIDSLVYIFGGQVFYGGLIGGLLAGYIYLKKRKEDVGIFAYLIAPVIPLFHAFGRIGCFLGGCCYGIEMEGGITYHNSLVPSANDVPRLPIQLIEASANFILFLILYYLQRKNKCKDTLLLIYLMSYSVIRFIDEFFRGDDYRGFIGPLSTSQAISIAIFTFSLIRVTIIKHNKIRRKNASDSHAA